jgi:ParB-like chromosome segregation protein Spo0J
MKVHKFPIRSIDFDDELFRISEELEIERLRRSLETIGLIQPVVLSCGRQDRLRIVCGFRRLYALRSLGFEEVEACVHTASLPDLYLMALWDNLAARSLTILEIARALYQLTFACGVSAETVLERFFPVLDLPAQPGTLQTYLSLHQMDGELRHLLNAGWITKATAERLARTSPETQASAAVLFARVRWSASLQREMLDLAEDLAAIASRSLPKVFAHDEITAISLDESLTPYQRGERIHICMYRLRNPRISQTRDRFGKERLSLKLPGSIRISPDPFFESPRLKVEFEADSASIFRQTVQSLEHACAGDALERLFDIS